MKNIYDVENGANWYVIADDEQDAIQQIIINLKRNRLFQELEDMGFEGFIATEMPISKDIKLFCDEHPITHTVADWLMIYEGTDKAILGCSEY